LTDSFLVFSTRPWPRQAVQGSEIVLPRPRQVGQVCWTWKKPCCMRTCPAPPQVPQVVGCCPCAHRYRCRYCSATRVGTRISTVVPRTASSRRDIQGIAQIRAALGPPRPRATAAKNVAEYVAENVAEAATGKAAGAARLPLYPGMAEAVVGRALLADR
jgi:hypothetical protein